MNYAMYRYIIVSTLGVEVNGYGMPGGACS